MTKLAAQVQEKSDAVAEHLRRALYPAIKCLGNTTAAWLRADVLPEYDRCGVPRPFIWRREWTDDNRDEWVRRGKAGAQAFFEHTVGAYDSWADLTNVVEGINEFVAWTVDDMRWLNEFDAEAAVIWQAHGRQYIGGNWSVGHPEMALWPHYRDALARMDFLGLHAYGWPEGVAEDGGPFLWHPWRVFRHELVRQTILANDMRLPLILLTEVGWARGVWNGDLGDVGFKTAPDPNAYYTWLTGFDYRVTADVDLLYAAIFLTGAKSDWETFDPVRHYVGNVLADYTRADALQLPPEPPPDSGTDGFTPAEIARCRTGLGLVPATIKASIECGLVWVKELYVVGDPYALAVAYDPQAKHYVALKLETGAWQVVAQINL